MTGVELYIGSARIERIMSLSWFIVDDSFKGYADVTIHYSPEISAVLRSQKPVYLSCDGFVFAKPSLRFFSVDRQKTAINFQIGSLNG